MKTYKIVALLTLCLVAKVNLAQTLTYPHVTTRVMTIAGELQIVLPEPSKWYLKLGDKIIFQDNYVQMMVLKHINHKISPFHAVVVLHRPEGSYCKGGTFWFLGLKRDGSSQLSLGIGECFAHEPVVFAGNNYVKVKVKSDYGNNRTEGEPYLRGGTWIYRNGQVTKIKTRE